MNHQKKLTWGAVLMALSTATGSGFKAYFDSKNDDSVKTVIAREKATVDEWRRRTEIDLGNIREENQDLHDAVIKLTASVEMLSRGQRVDARASLPEMLPPVKRAPVEIETTYDAVQQVKVNLFE